MFYFHWVASKENIRYHNPLVYECHNFYTIATFKDFLGIMYVCFIRKLDQQKVCLSLHHHLLQRGTALVMDLSKATVNRVFFQLNMTQAKGRFIS